MGSSKKVTVGYRYNMGLHMGLCHEPDALLEIMAGDRTAWIGQVTESTTIQINAPSLFGGDEREGGIAGTCDVMMGRPDQLPNAYLAEHQGTPQPAYRGFLGLVYRGLIASNNPYIKNWAVRVRSILRGWHGGEAWYPERASVELMDGSVVMHGPGWEYQVEHFSEPNNAWSNFTVPVDGWQQAGELPITTNGAAGGEYWTPMRSNLWLRRRITVHGRGLTLNIGAENGCVVWINGENVGTSNAENISIPNNEQNPVSYFLGESGHLDVVVKAFAEINASDDGGGVVVMSFTGAAMQGMNPAHIIFQALTDPDWGMGYPAATIDEASFRDAADKLHAEGLGLCMKWNTQTTIQEFTQIIADHASLVYGQDRRTGLFRMRLLRQDYNEADLPVFTKRDVKVIRYQRPSLADTVNEVIVQYTDHVTGEDATTAPLQNLANIQGQGRVVSQTLSFPGIVTHALASRVGMRELQARSTPLWRFSLEANRRMASLLPGEPFVLDLLDTDIGVRLVMRAGDLDYGETADAVVRAECVEDVFGMPATTYVGDPGPGGEVPNTKPRPATATAFEVPYRELVQVLDPPALAALSDDAGYVATVAAKPSGAPINYGLFTRLPPGQFDEATVGDFAPYALLAAPIGKTDTELTFGSSSTMSSLEVGQGVFIGEGREAEMVRVDAVDLQAGTMAVGRGCGDTIPNNWPAGTKLWGFDEASAGDPVQYVEGELVEAKVVPRSASGELPLDQAPALPVTIQSRQARPYPPADVRINGATYPEEVEGPIVVSWKHRDRRLQADTLIAWQEPSIGPEPGTTYTAEFYQDVGIVPLHTESGIDGAESPAWEPPADGAYRVELFSTRDGLESWHRFAATVQRGTTPAPVFWRLASITAPAAAVFSLRKMYPDAARCMRVRRSSDNAEADIGFDGPNIDLGALSEFVGGGSGFVVTLYDQSGNEANAVQPAAAAQPIVVQSGEFLNRVKFNGSTSWMLLPAFAGGTPYLGAFFRGVIPPNAPANRIIIEPTLNYNNAPQAFLLFHGTTTFGSVISANASNTAGSQRVRQFPHNETGEATWSYKWDRADSGDGEILGYKNGDIVNPRNAASVELTGPFGTFDVYIGARAGTSLFSDMEMETLALYRSDTLNARVPIQNVLIEDASLWRARLNAPVSIAKHGAKYFIADCWHHRLLRSDSPNTPAELWDNVDEWLRGPHSVAYDGTVYVADNTDHGSVVSYQDDGGQIKKLQTLSLGPGSHRPHRVDYDPGTEAFYVMKSLAQQIVKLKRSGSTLSIEHTANLPFLSGQYTRGFRIIGGQMYFAAEPGRVYRCSFDGSAGGYVLLNTYNLPAGFESPNDIFKASDGTWYATATNQAMVSGASLEAIHSGTFVDVYAEWGLEGTPYYLAEFDGALWVPSIIEMNGLYRVAGGIATKVLDYGTENASSYARHYNPPT